MKVIGVDDKPADKQLNVPNRWLRKLSEILQWFCSVGQFLWLGQGRIPHLYDGGVSVRLGSLDSISPLLCEPEPRQIRKGAGHTRFRRVFSNTTSISVSCSPKYFGG